ncbi:unnamed protein product [Owenia fusiformis]|uniref:glutathione transferase n=1 Tax=Owenia fusiformis TaxID=6347 RepID=A0A8J1UY07_OWEFU|nr:unnamed protein product [Owenia fusiformis]
MPKYRLVYFNARGRAETPRILFALAGEEYEDVRLFPDLPWPSQEGKDKWLETKSELGLPFGQVPVLDVDGKRLCQSNVIAKYLARQFGYAGKGDWEEARAEMISACVYDAFEKGRPCFMEQDPIKKAELLEKFLKDSKEMMDNFRQILEENDGGSGFFVGDGITWADINFAVRIDQIFDRIGENADTFLKDWPKLLALKQRVEKYPKIAEWIEKRPKTTW